MAAETRLRNVQALFRREQAQDVLAADLPLRTREVVWALRPAAGPAPSGIVVL